MSPSSLQGCLYAICFIDDYYGLITEYFLKLKSDAVGAAKKYIVDVVPYGEINRFRSDNGAEYTSKEFANLIFNNEIIH